MTDTKITLLDSKIRKAARSVAFQWPTVVDRDEVYQMIYERLLKTNGSVKKILAMAPDAQYRAIVGIGHQLASQERADYDLFKGSYRYSVSEVRNVLTAGVLVEEFDFWMDTVHDLLEALEALHRRTPQYVDAIVSRYAEFKIPAETAGKDALKNGVTSLVAEMNKSNKRRFAERDVGVGTRKPLSCERSRWESKGSWDADYLPAPAHMRDNATEPEVWS
ncbi:hypothetical protein [Mycolicibacter minnesotensis]|nr:hypothetical protein [Mycolicibacter minnesotensis]BBY34925.1 hypothetical protein MMIN_29860 [Mycolicibacter minnesotensis]